MFYRGNSDFLTLYSNLITLDSVPTLERIFHQTEVMGCYGVEDIELVHFISFHEEYL